MRPIELGEEDGERLNCDGRVVIWFSCGAASAVAAKMAVRKYPDAHVVYCDLLASEHPYNKAFLVDVQGWIRKKIEPIKSKKFASIEAVWDKAQYMSGPQGAPCTREMKVVPRLDYQLPNDLHVFGLTADETDRIADMEAANPELEFEWILRDNGITKEHCYGVLRYEFIALPPMYEEGFEHNNCLGCVKATSPVYWDKIRRLYPHIWRSRCEQSRRLGVRLVRYHGTRIFLDELPEVITDLRKEPDIECGVICVKPPDQQQAEMFG